MFLLLLVIYWHSTRDDQADKQNASLNIFSKSHIFSDKPWHYILSYHCKRLVNGYSDWHSIEFLNAYGKAVVDAGLNNN